MVLVAFFQWWYGRGWLWQVRYTLGYPAQASRSFDLMMLIKTLFKPWKRVSAVRASGSYFQRKLSEWGDAFVARLIGFIIRAVVIAVGLVWLVVGSGWQLLVSLAWPLLPLAPFALVVFGVTA